MQRSANARQTSSLARALAEPPQAAHRAAGPEDAVLPPRWLLLRGEGNATRSQLAGDLHGVSSRLRQLLGLTGVAIAVSQAENLICTASSGPAAPPLGTRVDRFRGLSAECLRTGESCVSNDVEQDTRVNREVCRRSGVRSTAAFPLVYLGAPVGLMAAFSNVPGYFTHQRVLFLELLGGFVARAVEQSRLGAGAAVSAEIAVLSEQPETEEAGAPTAVGEEQPLADPVAAGTLSLGQTDSSRSARSGKVAGMAAVAAILLIAAGLFWISRNGNAGQPSSRAAAKPAETAGVAGSPKLPVPPATQKSDAPAEPAAPLSSGIQYSSARGFSRFVLALDRDGGARCGRLKDPERLYCDIEAGAASPHYSTQALQADALVERVRIGEARPGFRRIVFDLRSASVRHVIATLKEPPRLVVEFVELPLLGIRERPKP